MQDLINQWKSQKTIDIFYNRDFLKNKHLEMFFLEPLEFGTAGIRGKMGFGSGRINEFTIGAAAKVYGQFLIENKKENLKNGVIIAHDNRHNSFYFAQITFLVLKEMGINAYLFEENALQPTPLVSFTIRKLKLAGACIITASHNPKEYNGFKVYNHLGSQLLPNDTKIIQKNMHSIDPLKVARYKGPFDYIDNRIIEEYEKEVLNIRLRKDDQSQLKVVFTPQHGTAHIIGPSLLEKMGIQTFLVKKQMSNNPDFKYTKTPNPEDGKAFKKALHLGNRKKADLLISTDPDADRLGIVVRYKRVYKFINGNEMAALYLDYMIKQKKRMGLLKENSFIVTTHVSGDLAQEIAKNHQIKIYKTHVGFKNISQIIEEKTNVGENFLFAYEESFGFLVDANISRDKDGLQAMVGVVEMANYYKTQNTNLFSKLKELFKQYNIFRTVTECKVVTSEAQDRLLSRISKFKTIANLKVDSIEDYRKTKNEVPQKFVKINLKGGSWIAIRPSGTEPKLKIYIQTKGQEPSTFIDVAVKEKEIIDFIDDNVEMELPKSELKKNIFKYSIFIGILAFIFFSIFWFIYKTLPNQTIFNSSNYIFQKIPIYQWIIVIFWVIVVSHFIDAWIKKRILNILGEKVKFKHLLIGSYMGSIISYITPFSFGGDIIIFWFLKKKKVRTSSLLAMVTIGIIIFQTRLIAQTFILIPLGIEIYKDLLFGGDAQKIALTWFIVGLGWTAFSTFMLFTLSLSKTIQRFIIKNSIKLLEWIPFIDFYDPGAKYALIQNELNNMQLGFRILFKKFWFFLELLFYSLLMIFFQPVALFFAVNGFIRPDLKVNPYLAQIVAWDVINTSNSISFTPGGAGTLEWLNIAINQMLFDPSIFDPQVVTPDIIASAVDFNNKLVHEWPNLLISFLTLTNVFFAEKRIKKYALIKKNENLSGNEYTKTTKIYWYTSIGWVILISTWITMLFLLHNFL